jgi:hypothetical protein
MQTQSSEWVLPGYSGYLVLLGELLWYDVPQFTAECVVIRNSHGLTLTRTSTPYNHTSARILRTPTTVAICAFVLPGTVQTLLPVVAETVCYSEYSSILTGFLIVERGYLSHSRVVQYYLLLGSSTIVCIRRTLRLRGTIVRYRYLYGKRTVS